MGDVEGLLMDKAMPGRLEKMGYMVWWILFAPRTRQIAQGRNER